MFKQMSASSRLQVLNGASVAYIDSAVTIPRVDVSIRHKLTVAAVCKNRLVQNLRDSHSSFFASSTLIAYKRFEIWN